MKLVKRNWKRLTAGLAAGLVFAIYALAQTPGTPTSSENQTADIPTTVSAPDAQEAADSAELIGAVNSGNFETALQILHKYGVADSTLATMGGHLGQPITPASLNEPFLKASLGSMAQMDWMVPTNLQGPLDGTIGELGYGRTVWIPRRLDALTIDSHDAEIAQCAAPPITVLNIKTNDPCFIRYFKFYDRYADALHSVVLNGPLLTNAKLGEGSFSQANFTLNALYQLIKARNPNAFVWLGVVNETDGSDEQWLKAMTFTPDGLQISNLRQFHSPFADTRRRYTAIMGTNMPMMIYGFYGYTAALQKNKTALTAAWATNNLQAAGAATAQLGGIGTLAGENLAMLETNLQALGYRGLSTHWLLLAALANSTNAAPPNTYDLVDADAGKLDTYFETNDNAHVFSKAASMISNSVPGSMDWTVGKLYEGMALLSQTPPHPAAAIIPLDEVLAFNYTNRIGREHYILGAVKWRIYAAHLSGDPATPPRLAQWVQNQNFRADLKADFMKKYGDLLTAPATTSPTPQEQP